MKEISYEDFKKLDEFNEFINKNKGTGKIKIQVFQGNQAIPISNAKIKITKDINGKKVVFYTGMTNISGIIEDIVLPTPNNTYNIETKEVPEKTIYKLTVDDEKYEEIKNHEIGMLNNVNVLQYLKLIPKIEVL